MASVAGYAVLIAMLIIPMYVTIHPYLHMLIIAPTVVFIGCQRSVDQMNAAPEEKQTETLSSKDAMQFPLIGSCVLFGLYLVVKFVNKEYLSMLLAAYFFILGAGAIFSATRTPVNDIVKGKKYSVTVNWEFWKKPEGPVEPTYFTIVDLFCIVLGIAGAVGYVYTKHFAFNNLLGSSFSITGIELIVLGSYKIGCMLLTGLFFYDIFWVFGTEVMVTVAKGFDAPVKLLFPKSLMDVPLKFSMLGLGDIVIPGIFVAMLLRFDYLQNKAKGGTFTSTPYFNVCFVFYVLGLVATVAVMHFFEAAQPALLYLVPACMGSSFTTALVRGEVKALLAHNEEEKEAKDSEKED